MQKLKKNIKYFKFLLVSILYLFIIYYFSEKLLTITLTNIVINIIYRIFSIVILLTAVVIGFKFIFKHFNPFSEIDNLTKEERKQHSLGISAFIIIAILIDRNVPYDKIEPDFIRLLLRSCYTITAMFIYAKYINIIKKESEYK